jgi:hypothetical protein
MKSIATLLLTLALSAHAAEDTRVLAAMPAPAQAALREEMRDHLVAVHSVLSLLAAGSVKEAGALAEQGLGTQAMGRHRNSPFDARPGRFMPEAMHALGMDGHKAASEFARIAATGDRDKALAAWPAVTTPCVACHMAYRIR